MTVNFQGWLMSPKLRYLCYVWTSNTSQGLDASVVVGGNVNYAFDPHFTLGAGIDALPGVRATEGNFPFWLTTDNRLIADEFFRPSYTMGVWARGKVVERLSYRLMLGNNLSQFGVDAGQLDDKLSTVAAALIWLPTTGEFGTAAASATSTPTSRSRPASPRTSPAATRTARASRPRTPSRTSPSGSRTATRSSRPSCSGPASGSRTPPTRCSAPTAASSTAASRSRASTTGGG